MITKPIETPTETDETVVPPTRHLPDERAPAPAHSDAQNDHSLATGKRHPWRWAFIVGMAAGVWFTQQRWLPFIAPGLAKGSAVPAKGGPKPIPVRTAVVQQRDMPVLISGLGTVTAFKTVTLRSRVDGELIKVAFTEGQMVRAGELLAEIDPRVFQAQLQQAEGMLAKDEATLKLAKITLARGEDLLKTKNIAPQQVDEEAAQVQTMEGTVQTDQAMVANARLQLTYCRIVAPISGRIGLRLVDQGNIVHANDLTGMAVITQLQPISLVFPVSQDEIPRVQKQMNSGATLTVYAYDRNFKQKLATGKLAAIDNQVDSTTGTVRLKAVFDNEDGMLFPNQFVNARLLIDTNRDAVIVPAAAVQRGPTSAYVYVVQPDEKVKLRNVEVGLTEGAETAISTGLVPGEIVVTDGIDKLKDDAAVTTKEAKESRAPATTTEPPSNSEKRAEPVEPAAENERGKASGPKDAR
jgi:multidrug efflux system membrane fusion protein